MKLLIFKVKGSLTFSESERIKQDLRNGIINGALILDDTITYEVIDGLFGVERKLGKPTATERKNIDTARLQRMFKK